MTKPDTSSLLAQLRTVLDLTNTEIQIAETRVAQARTDAVRRELTQNAENGRARSEAIGTAIRDLGGFPDDQGPMLGRAAAAVKALTEQAEPFQEALLGDLALEDQLLDRARYIKALAVAAQRPDIEKLFVPVDHCPRRDGGLADHRAGRRRAGRSGGAASHAIASGDRDGHETRQSADVVVHARL